MEHCKYDVFISYRHRYTADKAEHLLTLLENNGYRNRVSFDKDNLTQRFDLELIHRIDNCTDFIIVLSEDTFADIIDSDAEKYQQLAICPFNDFESLQKEVLPKPDFTRLELARAIAQGKNIVPIAPIKNERYNFDELVLPADIQHIIKWQAIFYDTNSSLTFQEVIEVKLLKAKKSLLKSKPPIKPKFSWKIFGGLCVFVVLCLGGVLVWKDYQSYKRCQSINDYNKYIVEGQGIFNRRAKKHINAINKFLEFSDCTDEIKSIVKGKDYTHLTRLQAETLNKILANMVYVHGGKFLMGSDDEQVSRKEKPCHEVEVEDFFICKFEVSRHEWNAIRGIKPSTILRDSLDIPITHISWNEVSQWIKDLNSISGLKFSLPHEKEWEYAAKGGNYKNDNIYAGGNTIEELAWTLQDSIRAPRPQQRDGVTWHRRSNELGLHNMSGNVSEMCSNDFYYYDKSKTFIGKDKVIRGGSYESSITNCTVTYRDLLTTTTTSPSIGFRLIIKN